jgi:hypothetical protein
MNATLNFRVLLRRRLAAVLALLVLGSAQGAWAQSPYFPNTRAAPYSPYGFGGYGPSGVMTRYPHVFRPMPRGFFKPASAMPFIHPLPTAPGAPAPVLGPNLDAAANFHPLGQ